jgi:hypothetical protein
MDLEKSMHGCMLTETDAVMNNRHNDSKYETDGLTVIRG